MKNLIKLVLALVLLISVTSAVYYPYKTSTALSADISMNNHKLTNLATPTIATDAATKAYVDSSDGSGGDGVVTVGPYAWCDYVTDGINDYVEFQSAIDALDDLHGGKLVVADGIYNLGVSAPTITVKNWIEICGASNSITVQHTSNSNRNVAQIRITNTAVPAFTLKAGSTIRHLQFYYPNQATNGNPTVYAPTLQVASDGQTAPITIEYCHAMNPYIFFKSDQTCSGITIDNIKGMPIYKFAEINYCYDFTKLSNIHINPMYGTTNDVFPGANLRSWMSDNTILFDIPLCDGFYMSDVLCYGPGHTGVRLGVGGRVNWGHVRGLHMESYKYPLIIGGTSERTSISDSVFWAMTVDSALNPVYGSEDGITIRDTASGHMFSNCMIYAARYAIIDDGSGMNKFTNCDIRGDAANDVNNAVIYINAPMDNINNCHILGNSGKGVQITALGDDAKLIGNYIQCIGDAIEIPAGAVSTVSLGNTYRYGADSNSGGIPVVNDHNTF